MRKYFVCLLLALFSAGAALAKAPKAGKATLKTENDSVSYALGIEFGKSIVGNLNTIPGHPYNNALLLEALNKMVLGDTTGLMLNHNLTPDFLQNALRKAMEAENERVKKAGIDFLEKNKLNAKVVVTASGLQYEVLQMGNGVRPAATDKVRVHYKGTLIDGTVFDSSYDRGQPAEFELNRVIKGWTEGVQLMPVGSKFRFYVPSELGYGERGTGNIPANSVLIFDVELLDVAKPAPKEPQTIGGTKYQFKQYQRTIN